MPKPIVTLMDLVRAVRELSRSQPLVPSRAVKDWLDRNGIEWGAGHAGRAGRLLEAADKLASVTGGPLQKWKQDLARSRSAIGWSLGDEDGQARAQASGWHRIRWNPTAATWEVC